MEPEMINTMVARIQTHFIMAKIRRSARQYLEELMEQYEERPRTVTDTLRSMNAWPGRRSFLKLRLYFVAH